MVLPLNAMKSEKIAVCRHSCISSDLAETKLSGTMRFARVVVGERGEGIARIIPEMCSFGLAPCKNRTCKSYMSCVRKCSGMPSDIHYLLLEYMAVSPTVDVHTGT